MQSIDGVERKMTESTPMPNVEERELKTIEFSPLGKGDEITNNTPETMKDDSQTKRSSFKEKLAAMVGMKPREKEEGDNSDKKGKLFGTVTTITTEADQGKEQSIEGAVVHQNGQAAESK